MVQFLGKHSKEVAIRDGYSWKQKCVKTMLHIYPCSDTVYYNTKKYPKKMTFTAANVIFHWENTAFTPIMALNTHNIISTIHIDDLAGHGRG